MNKKFLPNIFSSCLLFLCIFIISFSLRANPFSNLLQGHDGSMFLYFGRGMNNGLAPYTDMLDHKGPVLFFIEYLAVKISFGSLSFGLWVMEVIFLSTTIIMLYKTIRLLDIRKEIASITIAIFVGLFITTYDGGNYSEEFALMFISISLYLFIKLFENDNLRRLEYMLIGSLGALTFFIRMNMIALWVVFCLYLIVKSVKKNDYRKLINQSLYIFVGGISVVLIIMIYGILSNNLFEMIQQAFIMNIKYASSSNIDKVKTIYSFYRLSNNFGIVAFLVLFSISFINNIKLSEGRRRALEIVLILYFCTNFYTVIVSGRDYTHYLITQLPPMIVLSSIGIGFLLQKINVKSIMYLSCMFLLLIPSYGIIESIKTYTVWINKGQDSQQSEMVAVSKYIKNNSSAKDKIYVHNINANIYLLSDRFANSKFFTLPSLNYDQFPKLKDEFRDDLDHKTPKFIVIRKDLLTKQLTDMNLDNTVLQKIDQSYIPVDKFNGEFRVYRLKSIE